ncbi:MAG: hypothetical protein KC425_26525 [Anaerolineales bacterium]|nr:hypothetical protein [Anaerolineales bacterium]
MLVVLALLLLAGCREDEAAPTVTPAAATATMDAPAAETAVAAADVAAATATPEPTTTPEPTATPLPPKELTVCMARLPQSLYLYGDASLQAEAVRHAVYEPLVTSRGYDHQAVGLQKLPAPADGDVVLTNVLVPLGERIVDASGNVHVLREGLRVFLSSGELVTVTNQPLEMQQMAVEFTLKPLVWSDGTPVTADDSVFSFEVAAAPETPGSKRLVQRTASYEAVGPLTVRWTGLPGYLDPDYMTNVWLPLPRHQLGGLSAAELAGAAEAAVAPLSSGSFVVSAATENGLTLLKNPFYYRAAEGLPRLDVLHVVAVADAAALLADGLAGCDVVTQDVLTFEQLGALAGIDGVETAVVPSAVYEHIDFSVNFYLAEGFQNFIRPDWFQDARVRQAFTQCTDRQRMIDEIFGGLAAPMTVYVPAAHPLYPEGLPTWPYDPAAANALLDAAGYVDADGDGVREDPATGRPFAVRLTTDNALAVRAQAAAIFQENLADCGIAVTPEFLPPEDWYNDGPLGTLFGRRFELGMFAWLGEAQPACHLWLARNITGPELEGFGGWGNVNVSGWADAQFEAACNAALNALPGTDAYVASHQAALRVWAEQLPMIPLFSYVKVVALRAGVSGVQPDVTQPSALWNVAEWDRDNG